MLVSDRCVGLQRYCSYNIGVELQSQILAPLAQSVERIHGKDGLRQVHASNPRRGGDNVKEQAGRYWSLGVCTLLSVFKSTRSKSGTFSL